MLLFAPDVLLSLSCPGPVPGVSTRFVLRLPCCGYLPVFPEVSGLGPMMEERGYCHLSANELCDLSF